MTIKFYKTREAHGYMSNYYKRRFYIFGRWWATIEHAYQAQKCVIPSDYDAIWEAPRANDARLLGQKVVMKPNWDTVDENKIYPLKYIVMYECVLAKFLQHKDLRDQLMATGDEELIEESPVDYYWGCGKDGSGQNMLGHILMRVRMELRGE